MNKSDFHVGQTVYLKTCTNLAECWKHERILEGTVTKIGRKYITVDSNLFEEQFEIENNFRQKTEYSADMALFLSKQDIYDYWQKEYLKRELQKAFSFGRVLNNGKRNIDLESLIAIAKILEIPVTYKEEGNGDIEDE